MKNKKKQNLQGRECIYNIGHLLANNNNNNGASTILLL